MAVEQNKNYLEAAWNAYSKKLKDLMAKRCTLYHDEDGRLIDYKEKTSGCGGNPEN